MPTALPPQDCELLYVAFDLLHNGHTALTEHPLSDRLERLRGAVVPGEPGGLSFAVAMGLWLVLMSAFVAGGGWSCSRARWCLGRHVGHVAMWQWGCELH